MDTRFRQLKIQPQRHSKMRSQAHSQTAKKLPFTTLFSIVRDCFVTAAGESGNVKNQDKQANPYSIGLSTNTPT
jgi:hypothetical protein